MHVAEPNVHNDRPIRYAQETSPAAISNGLTVDRSDRLTMSVAVGKPYRMRFPPFDVTKAAIDEIGRHGSVRIDLAALGCSGTAYVIDVADEAAADEGFGCEGARLVVSPAALAVLTGARLDYGSRLKPPRFRVLNNANTPIRCPCNRSFGREWPGRGHPDCQAKTPMPWGRQ